MVKKKSEQAVKIKDPLRHDLHIKVPRHIYEKIRERAFAREMDVTQATVEAWQLWLEYLQNKGRLEGT